MSPTVRVIVMIVRPSPPSSLGAVFLVGDVVEPGHDLSVLVRFLDGDVRHEAAGGRAVPVLLTGLDVDDVAGADLLRLGPTSGDVPDAVGDIERLPVGVVVPCGAGAGGEADVGAADRGLVVRVADAVDVNVAGEPVGGTAGGVGGAGGELHGVGGCFLGVVGGDGRLLGRRP